jgi:hypothetical protein
MRSIGMLSKIVKKHQNKIMYNENNFIEAISQSFANYLVYGSRSTQKLKPIHLFLAETLQNIFGKDY